MKPYIWPPQNLTCLCKKDMYNVIYSPLELIHPPELKNHYATSTNDRMIKMSEFWWVWWLKLI